MGIDLDYLTGEFGPDWKDLTGANITLVRQDLKLHTEDNIKDFCKSIGREKLHLYDGIIVELAPTVFFVYNSAANKFKFVGVKPDYLLMLFRRTDIKSVPCDIFDSKENFLNNYKGGNALVCLNDVDRFFDDKVFCSKYLILDSKAYIHIQHENFIKYYDHRRSDDKIQSFTLVSFFSAASLGSLVLIKNIKEENLQSLISVNFWVFFASILMSFIVQDFREENIKTVKLNATLVLFSLIVTITQGFFSPLSLFFAGILFSISVTQELVRRNNKKNLRKDIELRHSFIMEKLQGDI